MAQTDDDIHMKEFNELPTEISISEGETSGYISTESKISRALIVTERYLRYWFRIFVSNFRRGLLFKTLILFSIISLLFILFHPSGSVQLQNVNYQYYSAINSIRSIKSKKDLLNVNIRNLLKYKRYESLPLTDKILNDDYTRYNITGYVSNLDLAKHLANHKPEKKKNENVQKGEMLSEGNYHEGYENMVSCDDLEYNSYIEYSNFTKILEDDLIEARRAIIKQGNKASSVVNPKDQQDKKEEDIINKKWFRFGASAVWLEKHQCFVVYSRVIYSQLDRRNHPKTSFLRGQTFDKNWREIKGKRIPYDDVTIPTDMINQIENLRNEFGETDCESIKKKNGKNAYDKCITNQANDRLKINKEIETVLSKYYVTYPIVFDLPFDTNGDFKGPEDPRVIKRSNSGFEEPIVLFNKHDDYEGKRRMYAFFPHRKNDPLVKFKSDTFGLRHNEKNWTPFFHKEYYRSKISRGYIHFIYQFMPFEVLKCNLNDGLCEKVFQASTLDLSSKNKHDGMRGGTQFVQLPAEIPEVKGKQIWVGFPKLHIK
ncbi:hypothetical protein Kpol_457p16, partial [Vanderwaltozyma polyspora DSM 70294]